jgi:hypothetical protein
LGLGAVVGDKNPERRNFLANIENAPAKDVVDAEFTDADVDHHTDGPSLDALLEAADRAAPYQQRPRSKGGLPWIGVVLLLLAGAFIYGAFFRTNPSPETAQAPPAAGWMELGSCTFTRSFDGRRQMSLEDDQSAEVREPSLPPQQSKEGDERVSKGRWSYDETSKQYAVTVSGETTNYSLLSQDGIETCILVKGSFEAADLRESWFSASANDEPPDDDSREADRY